LYLFYFFVFVFVHAVDTRKAQIYTHTLILRVVWARGVRWVIGESPHIWYCMVTCMNLFRCVTGVVGFLYKQNRRTHWHSLSLLATYKHTYGSTHWLM